MKVNDPMGALNDLSFLLIIYFLVIAGFNTNRGFLLNLPSRDKPRIVQKDDLLKLALSREGEISLNGEPVTGEELDALLTQNLKAHPNMTVFLSLDPEVPYQKFVDTIGTIREKRVENFSFAMAGG
ncbi:MAG: biopolymer transporter ExbD [Spirochaetales bacterium]|nr:biopolymer transporter ExbD [Spirochaetales bacterium]